MQMLPEYGLERVERIRLILGIILIGFVAAVFLNYVRGAYLGLAYPYNTFLFTPNDKFNDFFNMYNLTRHLNPYFEEYFIKSNYYPFANIIFFLFTMLPKRYAFLAFSGLFILVFSIVNYVNLKTDSKSETLITVFVFSLLTYPFLFLLDRGNIEGYLFLLLYFFLSLKESRPGLSAFLLACAIALKIYPAVFLILLFSEKKFKEIFITLAWVGALTLISLLFHKGGFIENLQFIATGFGVNDAAWFVVGNQKLLSGVSLFTPLKIVLDYLSTTIFPGIYAWKGALQGYFIGVFFLFGLLSLYLVLVEKQLWKKTAILVIAMLLFPHVSFDYKLISIFLPMFLYINDSQKSKLDLFYVIAFALLLIPKTYYVFPNFITNSGARDINIGVVLNPLIMCILLFVIVGVGIWKWWKKRN
jgi:hypothetical protein